MTTVSVIIPAYNADYMLRRAIESAKKSNDFVRRYLIEVIVVDDASTDKTSQIAEKWNNENFGMTLIRHEQNRGVSEACNTGLDAARGDYAIVCAADDWLEWGCIIEIMRRLNRDTDVAVGCTKFWGRRSDVFVPEKTLRFYEHNPTLYPVLFDVRKVREAGLRYHTFRAGYGLEDWDMVLQMHEAGLNFQVMPDVVVLNHRYMPKRGLHAETLKREAAFIEELRERHPKLSSEARI